jgi:hypothetical protein
LDGRNATQMALLLAILDLLLALVFSEILKVSLLVVLLRD